VYGILIQNREDAGRHIHLREETVFGLNILKAAVPLKGRLGKRQEKHRLLRVGKVLYKRGVRVLLNPPDFWGWPVLEQVGLQPVDIGELCRAAAASLALKILEMRGWEPERAVVMLAGERAGRYLLRAAEELVNHVSRVVIDVPGEGRMLSEWLHREYGLPVLTSGSVRPALILAFDPSWHGTGTVLPLYGVRPKLLGAQIYAEGVVIPKEYPGMSLLAALFEHGLISAEKLRVAMEDPLREGERELN